MAIRNFSTHNEDKNKLRKTSFIKEVYTENKILLSVMKNILFILFVNLFITCGISKPIAQTAPISIPVDEKAQNTIIEEKKDSIQVNKPIEEKTKEAVVEEKKPILSPKTLSHQSWNALLAKHVSKDGTVNYKGFKQDKIALRAYLKALGTNMPTETWTYEDKLAYWLNVYNAFTVKLIIDNYPIKSIKDIKDPWDLRFFKLGVKWYTLNDVEHRVLRKMKDPRIHFGINCASISCPPLLNKAFTAKNVGQELEKLTIAFINDPKQNTITPNKIEISKIFSWFAKDFKRKGSLVSFLNKYSKITINTTAKKSFKPYNWSLNE